MKEWWQEFFIPVIGEAMFKPKATQTEQEVDEILRQTRLEPPARILDLACGVGRHSLLFAKKSFAVDGLDFSKSYLAEARKSAKREGVKLRLHHGDMKNLKPHFERNQFDLVVSLFNSFGYFEKRSDDKKMLKEAFRVLKPGGRLILNTLNGRGVSERLKKPVSLGHEPIKNLFLMDAARFDFEKRRTVANWTVIDARKAKTKIHRLSFGQNVYTHDELKELLRNIGYRVEKTWGLLPGGSFDPKTTWHQTIVARKPNLLR